MEPSDPGGGGGGGDVNFVMPPPIPIDDGHPLVLSGNNGGMFTQSGSSDDDLIAFSTAEPGVDRPLIVAPNARGLWMGFTFVANGTRFFVRAYTVTVYNGQIHYWLDTKPVDVLVMSAGISSGSHYQPATWSISGKLIGGGYFDCSGCNPVGQTPGTLSIAQLSVNAQGQITLKATVNVIGKTFSVVRNNWNRVH